MASRLYIQNAAPGYDPPTERGDWDDTASHLTRGLSRVKSGAVASLGVAETNAATAYDVLVLKLVSLPLPYAVTIDGTVTWAIGALESSTSMNAHWHTHIFVTAGNTDTVRGTLLTDYTEDAGVNEWPTAAAGHGANAAQTLSGVAAQAGDRIVVEIGYTARNISIASFTGTLWYGGTGGDLTVGGDETTLVGWVEFSKDLFTIIPTSIGSGQAFGATRFRASLKPSAIAPAEAFGVGRLVRTIAPAGIASAAAFGSSRLHAFISPSGIASGQVFGVTTVAGLPIVLAFLEVDPNAGRGAAVEADPNVAARAEVMVS